MSNNLQRWPEIDGARAIISTIVVLGHMPTALGVDILSHMKPWSWMPMDAFFVVSGYLLGRIALQNVGQPMFVRTYFMRRMLRIWPAYFFTVLFVSGAVGLAALLGSHHAQESWTWVGFAKQLSFLQYSEFWVFGERGDYLFPLVHTWSLAMEEHFYLLLPLMALMLSRISLGWGVAFLISWLLISPALLIGAEMHKWVLPARMHSFALGMLLALLTLSYENKGHLKVPTWVWILVTLLGIAATSMIFFGHRLPLWRLQPDNAAPVYWTVKSLSSAFYTLFVLAAIYFSNVHGGAGIRVLRLSLLVHLGKISYSTYLWHWPVLLALAYVLPKGLGQIELLIAGLAMTYIAAMLSYHYVETPFVRLKSRWQHGERRPERLATAGP